MLSLKASLLFPFIITFGFGVAQTSDDPYDLTYLKKGAAVGDSYAAGIGAGNEVNWDCSRYDGSYSNLVAAQLGYGPKYEGFDFTYSACSGAVISGVNDQVNKLSGGQEFIIMSAGGNDADLVGILNSCVYSFYGGLSHPNCDKKLEESSNTIQSSDFASHVDGLIANAKSKLADGGNIYYVGYAKFFDVSDRSCDAVSWHIWLNLFTREYLTLERRIGMNGVVDRMNNALRDAVSRAGPQVHFIDYDQYVGDSNGRYCQPATDESSGNSANRRDLFFYEMKSIDSPWLEVEEKTDWHDELRRRGNGYNDDGDDIPINGTLNALYGALIQQTLEGVTDIAALDYWNTDNDLGAEVGDDKRDPSKRSIHPSEDSHMPVPPSVHRWSARNHNGTQNVNHAALGSTVTMNNGSLVHTNNRAQGFGNSTSGVSSVGTVIANGTHVILSNGQPVPKFNIKKLFISDQTSRIFHPTQLGHSIVANLILYKMAAQRASELGITNFPSQDVTTSGDSPPQIGGAACSTDASDTWASRDPMISALKSFCAVPSNLRGTAGQSTSGTFNPGGFDYMSVSIEWNATANLGQHSCEAWLETVTDGCDVPGDGRNVDNMKHGGIIAYDSKAFDATLSITPLVVRQIWDKGQAGGQSCNPMDSHNYLDHDTLQSNIDDYCQKSAAQAGGIANSGQKFEQVYNDGTPDRVVLSTEWPEGPRNYQIWQTECTYYMGVLNNDCSIGGDANPMNWKHGGAMSDNNGVKYTITPTQERPPPPSSPQGFCQAQRTWWGYNWDVYGGGFESSDHGTELSRQISGCGAVTQFKFDYFTTPDGNKEWHASGTLPLFISDHCLGAAVASSGGYSMNC